MYPKGREQKIGCLRRKPTLVDGYMENKEELTCELKGASNITGKKYG